MLFILVILCPQRSHDFVVNIVDIHVIDPGVLRPV